MKPYCADDAVTIYHGDCLEVMAGMEPESVDAIVCDLPYGLGFMGKKWDDLPPGQDWAEQCLRVLKPGGHLLAFGGTRTYHRLAVAVEDAGFEIRDQIMWLYGSGFPKSLSVEKAIDKLDASQERRSRNLRFTAWLRSEGVTTKQLDAATDSNMGSHYLTDGEQPAVPTADMMDSMRPLVGKVPDWVEALVLERTVESEQFKAREKVGERTTGIGTGRGSTPIMGDSDNRDITAPATPEAQKWQGFGTALKPAHEPIVVARKPFKGTVAANCLEHGTGAINVDGCRVGLADGEQPYEYPNGNGGNRGPVSFIPHNEFNSKPLSGNPAGRWPANLLLDDEAARLLDAQSGELHSQDPATRNSHQRRTWAGAGTDTSEAAKGGRPNSNGGDKGGASRFFYNAKASSGERNAGLDGLRAQDSTARQVASEWKVDKRHPDGGYDTAPQSRAANFHPTVKPIEVMRWLVRLVTPPGGTVLDPFTGSGTTGIAAHLEGMEFIGIEREAEYHAIAEARIAWWSQFEGDTKQILKDEKKRQKAAA